MQLPSATNMLEMQYSLNQEKVAVCLMRHCYHDSDGDVVDQWDVRIGYAVYTTTNISLTQGELAEIAFFNWSSEIEALNDVFSYKYDADYFNIAQVRNSY